MSEAKESNEKESEATANEKLTQYIKEMHAIRLVVMVVIYKLNIPPQVKIVLLLLTDLVKQYYLYFRNGGWKQISKPGSLTQNYTYQTPDKFIDFLAYVLVYQIIVKEKWFTADQRRMLKAVLVYRAVGVGLFAATGNDGILVPFVDLFVPLVVVYAVLGRTNGVIESIGIGLSVGYKIYIEQQLHQTHQGMTKEMYKVSWAMLAAVLGLRGLYGLVGRK